MGKKPGLKKNFLFSISYQIIAVVLPLITTPYLARVFGASNVGVFSKTQAFAHYFLLFSMLGVNNYGNRAIARVRNDKYEMSKTFWEIYTFQVFMSVICSSLYLGYCLLIATENKIIYLLQGVYVIHAMFDINWCCFGMEKFKLTAIRSSLVKILSAICVFTFVKGPEDVWLYTLIYGVGLLLSVLAVWPFVLRHIVFVKPTLDGIKKHIKPNLILFWPVVAVSIYNIMDRIMLGWMSADEEVGFYTYAERIITVPTTLILALDNVVMPRMSNLYVREGNSKHINFLMDSVMMFAMFMAGAMAFGAAGISDIFATWFYGDGFARCGFFILLLSPVVIFKGWAGALRTQFIIPTGRDKIYVISLTAGAVINVILNVLLIPKMNGIGAIIGTLGAEFAVCFIQFFCCRKDINIKEYLINGASFCIIGAIMFFVIKALRDVSSNPVLTMALQIICGGLLYTLLAGFYMVKLIKKPVLVNEMLKVLRIKYRFKENRGTTDDGNNVE